MQALQLIFGPIIIQAATGPVAAPILKTVAYIAVAGIVSLIVTFAPAVVMKLPEASMFNSILSRFTRR